MCHRPSTCLKMLRIWSSFWTIRSRASLCCSPIDINISDSGIKSIQQSHVEAHFSLPPLYLLDIWPKIPLRFILGRDHFFVFLQQTISHRLCLSSALFLPRRSVFGSLNQEEVMSWWLSLTMLWPAADAQSPFSPGLWPQPASAAGTSARWSS